MKRTAFSLVTIGFLLLATSLAAQTRQATNEAFSWSAELVALDELTGSVTVKAPTFGDQTRSELAALKGGERIVLRWSGYDVYADAISGVTRSAATSKAGERFNFPVDFVSFDAERRYATFKVQIPATDVAKLKSLKPGEWITATSPHGASSKTTPVVSIRPYVLTASPSTAG